MGKIRQRFSKDKPRKEQNKSRKLLSWGMKAIAVFLVLGLVISGVTFWKDYKTPPEELVIRAIAETIEAPCYRYYSISKRIADGNETLLSEVWGEKNRESTHLSGKIHIVNSDFEIYQVNNKFYRQDIVNKQWLVVDDVGKEATQQLIQEIDPLGNFIFAGSIDAEYLGKEKIDGKRCKKYQIISYNDNDYLAASYGEFFYTVWVDRDGHLRQAEVRAVDKENPDMQLKMSVQFTVSEEEIIIEAPL